MSYTVFKSLAEACEAVGVDPYSCRTTSRRWAPADILGDPHGKGDARIRLFDDDKGGVVWNWKLPDGDQCAVFFNGEGKRKEIERYVDHKMAQVQKEADAEQKATSRNAIRVYKHCESIFKQAEHPYLQRKGVDPARLVKLIPATRLNALLPEWNLPFSLVSPVLVLPAVSFDRADAKLKLWSLQFIDENGTKRFLPKGRIKKCFCPINGLPTVTVRFQPNIHLIIGEGFATVQSVMQRGLNQDGERRYGIVAFSCHGLIGAAQILRLRYPNALITILGDIGNGSEQAKQAAIVANGKVFFPEFTQEQIDVFHEVHGKTPTDWNDYYEVLQYV